MINIQQEAIKALAGIILSIVLILTISYFNFSKLSLILFLIGINLLFTLGIFIKSGKRNGVIRGLVYPATKNSIQIAAFVYILSFLYSVGIWGIIAGLGVVVTLILYKRWAQYVAVKHHIETMIWGKPLKEFIDAKEKPPKIKIVWKKKYKEA